jgi:hypothetical protein
VYGNGSLIDTPKYQSTTTVTYWPPFDYKSKYAIGSLIINTGLRYNISQVFFVTYEATSFIQFMMARNTSTWLHLDPKNEIKSGSTNWDMDFMFYPINTIGFGYRF